MNEGGAYFFFNDRNIEENDHLSIRYKDKEVKQNSIETKEIENDISAIDRE